MASDDLSPEPVRIPADVDREDRVLAGLTARQVAILAVAGAALWLAWLAARHLVPPLVFAGAAAPVALAAVVVAAGRRDGLSLDRWLAAAWRQTRAPRRLVPAPGGISPPPRWITPAVAGQALPLPAPLRLPVTAISTSGVITIGDGTVALAAASTVNFTLRTAAEQQALTAAFGRWLNSLQHPAQILIRTHRAGLAAMAARLQDDAVGLPDPALERAALDHAAFLARLAEGRGLLARQVLITVRDPSPDGAARRIRAAAQALAAAAGVAVTPLDAAQATAVLAACCDPAGRPPAPGTAPPGHVVTAAAPASVPASQGEPWRS